MPSSTSTSTTPAQDEFNQLVARNADDHDESSGRVHPEDRDSVRREAAADSSDLDEEDRHRADQIDAAMRIPTFGNGHGGDVAGADIKLPPASFDSGRATGVKGVIADARSYEQARRNKWRNRARAVRRSVFGPDGLGALSLSSSLHDQKPGRKSESGGSSTADEDGDNGQDDDEESFLSQWRESRKRELEAESRTGAAVRNRRTSPSVRLFGRLDEVDALGYLDAIEKVGKEVVVVVFVYDDECQVSAIVESALRPLVRSFPAIHFVKVHFEAIEMENAGVPAILAYRHQGDLFANLTGLVEMVPADEDVDTTSLKRLFASHGIL